MAGRADRSEYRNRRVCRLLCRRCHPAESDDLRRDFFSLDFYIDNINILPTFIVPIGTVIALFTLKKYVSKISLALVSSFAHLLTSCCVYAYSVYFYSKYTLNMTMSSTTAYDSFNFLRMIKTVDSIVFFLMFLSLIPVLKHIILNYTGFAPISENNVSYQEKIKQREIELNAKFCNHCGFDTTSEPSNDESTSKTIKCSSCNADITEDTKFCPECGNKYNPCSNCKADIPDGAADCPVCGTKGPSLCPGCGKMLSGNSKFCPECGYSLVKECKNCGNKIEGDEKFCPECGTKIE